MLWSLLSTDVLWRNALIAIPLALIVAGICRLLPCRASTRHLLWLTVLLVLFAPPGVPRLHIPTFTTASSTGVFSTAESAGPRSDAPATAHADMFQLPEAEPIPMLASDLAISTAPAPAIAAEPLFPITLVNDFRSLLGRASYLGHRLARSWPIAWPSALAQLPHTNPVTPASIAPSLVRTEPTVASGAFQVPVSRATGSPESSSIGPPLPRSVTSSPVHGKAPVSRQPVLLSHILPSQHSLAEGPSPVAGPATDSPRGPAQPSTDPASTEGARPSVLSSLSSISRALFPLAARTFIPALARAREWLSQVAAALRALPALPSGLWLTGSVGLATIAIVRLITHRRVLRRSSEADQSTLEAVADAARALGLRRAPATLMVPSRISPMIWCGRRPRLILPTELWAELDGPGRQAVIYHELAHLKRRDHWVCWAELIASALYWWHPLVWFIRRRLREEADLCCDAWVTMVMPRSRRAYAEALLETRRFINQSRSAPPAVGLGAISGPARHFARRLTMVMTQRMTPRRSVPGTLLALSLGAAGVLAAPLLACPPEDSKTCKDQKAGQATTAYTPALPAQPFVPAAPPPPRTPRAAAAPRAAVLMQPTQPGTPAPRAFSPAVRGGAFAGPSTTAPTRDPEASDRGGSDDLDARMQRLERRLDELNRRLDHLTERLGQQHGQIPSGLFPQIAGTTEPLQLSQFYHSQLPVVTVGDHDGQHAVVVLVGPGDKVQAYHLDAGRAEKIRAMLAESGSSLGVERRALSGLTGIDSAELRRQVEQAQVEANRARAQALTEANRAREQAQAEANRTRQQAQMEANRARQQAQVEASRARDEAQAELRAQLQQFKSQRSQLNSQRDRIASAKDQAQARAQTASRLQERAEALSERADQLSERLDALKESAESLEGNARQDRSRDIQKLNAELKALRSAAEKLNKQAEKLSNDADKSSDNLDEQLDQIVDEMQAAEEAESAMDSEAPSAPESPDAPEAPEAPDASDIPTPPAPPAPAEAPRAEAAPVTRPAPVTAPVATPAIPAIPATPVPAAAPVAVPAVPATPATAPVGIAHR